MNSISILYLYYGSNSYRFPVRLCKSSSIFVCNRQSNLNDLTEKFKADQKASCTLSPVAFDEQVTYGVSSLSGCQPNWLQ